MLSRFLFLIFFLHVGNTEECNVRKTPSSSIVCVCNATYCDTLPALEELQEGTYQLFISSNDGLRLNKQKGVFSEGVSNSSEKIAINRFKTYQVISGFGGAFTDSAGINIASLPEAAQEKLLRSYFSSDGAEYNMGRVPIGGTDFSARGYTYADEEDENIENFSLQHEDHVYKIPYILKAINLTNGNLQLLASAWSSPVWMKTTNTLNGILGFLKEEYYQTWADYYLKFFDAYEEYGIKFWGVTTQNEPASGIFFGTINNLAWTPSLMMSWINENFGPSIRGSNHSHLKILIHDDQSVTLPFVQMYYNNATTLGYIDGVGVHWYASVFFPESMLDFAKTDKKEIFMLQTEASAGYLAVIGIEKPVELGSWFRAAVHAKFIIQFLNHDGVGWIDWNLALDLNGGPNWVDNFVDSPIIVNATAGEFYKQPLYYTLSHFSKYIPRGSVRVEIDNSLISSSIHITAFQRPDGSIAIVLYNGNSVDKTIEVSDINKNGYIPVSMPPYGIATLIYK